MHNPWLWHLKPPSTHKLVYTLPHLLSFLFVFLHELCSVLSSVSYTTAIVAAAAAWPYRHGCMCVLHSTKTFGRFHTIFASQRPAAQRQFINLWNSLESQLWYLSP